MAERSYDKKINKSNPVGIRFNLAQEMIAKSKSGCATRQQLVDFLIAQYVNNAAAVQVKPTTEKSFDGSLTQTVKHDEPGQWEEPNADAYATYVENMKEAKTAVMLDAICKNALIDRLLSNSEKNNLKILGEKIYAENFQ